jgi:hypothetical protein
LRWIEEETDNGLVRRGSHLLNIELNKNVLFIKLAVSLGYVGILTAILLLQNKQY